MKAMDADYAELALRTGMFCGLADTHLGREHFILLARAHAWELTEEKLRQWYDEAIALGVPAKKLTAARVR